MSEHSRQELEREQLSAQESLSALMDNEADDLELRRILKSCEQQPNLMATWERYHLVQSLLHGAARPVSPALSQRIAAQIAAESTPIGVQPARFSGWQQTAGKLAIAASVAVILSFAVQTDFSSRTTPVLVQQDFSAPPAVIAQPPQSLLASESTAPVRLDPAAQQRLREYLERVTFNEEEPVITVHIQDSPLYRLVNELGGDPQ